jgi:pantoate kinase
MNISKMSDTYLKDIMENPSLENIMKTVATFTGDDFEGNEELKEI